MGKKRFIDKKNATTYSLVFRPNGNDDGEHDDEEAPSGVPLDDAFEDMDPDLAEYFGMAKCVCMGE